ncbi:unnamed protein product [Caretta caretta]
MPRARAPPLAGAARPAPPRPARAQTRRRPRAQPPPLRARRRRLPRGSRPLVRVTSPRLALLRDGGWRLRERPGWGVFIGHLYF